MNAPTFTYPREFDDQGYDVSAIFSFEFNWSRYREAMHRRARHHPASLAYSTEDYIASDSRRALRREILPKLRRQRRAHD